jgi:hypothetical protein
LSRMVEHEVLVEQLFGHCISEYGGLDRVSYSFDLVGFGGEKRPPIFGSSRPDLYGKRPSDGFEIIGEAKTKGDLENVHTERQVADYSEYVQNTRAVLAFIVPWPLTRACRALIKSVNPALCSLEGKLIIFPGGRI